MTAELSRVSRTRSGARAAPEVLRGDLPAGKRAMGAIRSTSSRGGPRPGRCRLVHRRLGGATVSGCCARSTIRRPPVRQYDLDAHRRPHRRARASLQRHRIAEVGRFAVVAEHRGNVMLAAALMRAATERDRRLRLHRTSSRTCSRTTAHSPVGFHTAGHGLQAGGARTTTANSTVKSRRITLVPDLKMSAHQRLKARGNSGSYRYLTARWPDALLIAVSATFDWSPKRLAFRTGRSRRR